MVGNNHPRYMTIQIFDLTEFGLRVLNPFGGFVVMIKLSQRLLINDLYMSNSFIPKTFQPEPTEPTNAPVVKSPDSITQMLTKAGQYTVVLAAFLIPLLFVPGGTAPLGFVKAGGALILGLVAVMFSVLVALRVKSVRTVLPLPLLLFFGLVVAALVSALLSSDVVDAIQGSVIEPQTVGFMAIMGLLMTTPLLLQQSKLLILYTLIAFASSVGLVLLYSVVRFFFGPVLAFDTFTAVTSTPAGSLNDVAVFAAVTIIVGLIALLQLPLKLWMKVGIVILTILSLITLMVANFFTLWIIVGFFGLLFLIYVLARDTLFGSDSNVTDGAGFLVGTALLVCIVSGLFVIAGDFAGARINEVTGVSYLEVRPSFSATMDMVRASYEDDILLGSGPNRFADVWRNEKDLAINETQFWNIDFRAGYGLVPTWFVTLGLLGGLLVLAFHASYIYLMFKTLLRTERADSFWLFAASASFATAGVLWMLTYVYVPGSALLLVTALFTGLSFVSYRALVPSATVTAPLAASRNRGFMMIALAVVVITVAIQTLFVVGKQFAAQTTFASASATADSVEEFELGVERAYSLFKNEAYLLALHQIRTLELQQLATVAEPSEEQQQQFALIAQQSIALAQEAVSIDSTNPAPYQALADTYNLLARAGVEGARDRVNEVVAMAEAYDQKNPLYPYSRAFNSATTEDYEAARNEIQNSLNRKSNFTPALFLLSQIAIEEGNVSEAIAATQQIIRFEPNNPARLYQLGLLLAANEQLDEAIAAYEQALRLDPVFANARYMLGLALVAQGNVERALEEFRAVAANNPDNSELQSLINELETTGTLSGAELGLETPVTEVTTTNTDSAGVVASSTPETNLITPINTEAASQESAETE